MKKISAVYQIINSVTGDRYVGSSRNVYSRWAHHKCPSTWENKPNSPLYHDMQKYGLDKFRFQILALVMPEYLKQVEQEFIDTLQPTYNSMNAKGLNAERRKETCGKYYRRYAQSEKGKSILKRYQQSEKGKENRRKAVKMYLNQLCSYNGETLKLSALIMRFERAGIPHATLEAKKYLKDV